MAFGYRGDPRWLVPHPMAGHGDGLTYGAAILPAEPLAESGELAVIFAGGPPLGEEERNVTEGWEHVSVSRKDRAPTWDEMVRVKKLFWAPEDCVVQFHPPRSEYVNIHPHCLHLWRHPEVEFPRPPKGLL